MGDNTVVAAIAVAEVTSVVDIEVEVAHIVAIAEMNPRMYFVVAIVAVDILGSVTATSFIPLST